MKIRKLVLAVGLLATFVSSPMYAGMFDWFWNMFGSTEKKAEPVESKPMPAMPATPALAPNTSNTQEQSKTKVTVTHEPAAATPTPKTDSKIEGAFGPNKPGDNDSLDLNSQDH